MRAQKNILCGAFATASGILIESLDTKPFHWMVFHAVHFGWIYQLIIGVVMMVVGVCAFSVSYELRTGAKVAYAVSSSLLFIAGLFVFTNLDRYAAAFKALGTWPVFVIGMWVAFEGALTLGNALTIYEPPAPA